MKLSWKLLFIPIFLLLTIVFFYQTILFGKLPVPADTLVGLYHPWRDLYAADYPRGVPFKNFLITDPIRQQIPWRKIAIDAWKSLRASRFNPYTFTGVPLDANIQAATFYPLNILFFVFSFPVAWTILIMLQPLLAGVFLYMYLTHHRLSPWAALLGAISWAFSGFAISWLTWGTIMQTALWLPLLLLSVDHIAYSQKKNWRWIMVGVAASVMTLTAGHTQVAFYMMLVAFGYYIWRTKEATIAKRREIRFSVLIIVLIAAVLTIPQWLPLLSYLPDSVRVSLADSWKKPGWFIPWQHLVQFIVPDFFGNPATMNYWGEWNYGELVGFIGVVPFIFALSAVFTSGIAAFFSATLFVALLFALPNPIASLPFTLHIPLIDVLQPTRLLSVVDLSLAVLSAVGFDAWMTKKNKKIIPVCILVLGFIALLWFITLVVKDPNMAVSRRNLFLPTVSAGLFILWFTIAVKGKTNLVKTLANTVLVFLVVFELFRFGWKFTPFTPDKYFFPETKVIEFLVHQQKPFRVMSLDDRILPPNVPAYYGIETIEGYDPVAPQRFEDFLAASERGDADVAGPSAFNRIYTAHNIDSPLLQYLNVRYVLTLTNIERPFLKKVFEEGETRVYEYGKAKPRMYLADTVQVVQKSQVLRALFASPATAAIVSKSVNVLSVPLTVDEGTYLITYASDRITFRASTVNKRVAILLNRFDPRWHVTIDHAPAEVLEANYLFMGVVVPAGTHEVAFVYR